MNSSLGARRTTRAKRLVVLALATVLAACAVSARAAEVPLLLNGGFEAGLGSWTVVNQTGGAGSFFSQTGTTSPENGQAVQPPPEGLKSAMSDSTGPGSHVLYQDFVVPANVSSVELRFQLYVANRHNGFFTPNTLDFNVFPSQPNQQARVDVIRAGADPFSLAPGDVLQEVRRTNPGDPLVSGYFTVSADLTTLFAAHAGETLRVRFAEVSNQNVLQLGVDDVSLVATVVPEPATAWIAIALPALACFRRSVRRPGAGRQRVRPAAPSSVIGRSGFFRAIAPRVM